MYAFYICKTLKTKLYSIMKKLVLLFVGLLLCCNFTFGQKNEKAIGVNLGYGR